LDLSAKKPRKLHDSQVYSHIYWKTKLSQVVANEWATHKQTVLEKAAAENTDLPTLLDTAPLPFCNVIVKRLLKDKSPEVKAEVEKYQEDPINWGKTSPLDDEMDEEESQHAARAEKYHE
jgi:uncharacterized protein YceK